MTKRWFNYRPICLIFAFLLLGSVFSFYLNKYKIISVLSAFLILILLLVIAFRKNNFKYFIIPFISFILGFVVYNIAISSFSKTIDSTPKVIEARIYSVNSIEDGSIVLEADNCLFDGIKINDNITLIIRDNSNMFEHLNEGSVIRISPTSIYKSDLFYYETPNAAMFTDDLKYTVIADIDDVSYVKEYKTLAEIIKSKIKTNLSHGLSNENVELAYSSLFGEKELLSQSQYNSYRLAGVAHLLAVSGLHVGILTLVLTKLLNLCKIKRWWRLAIIGIFLFFYAYICNFATSIIRASIMSLILILSEILFREYDSLTSISIAGVIIFLINPLSAFDVGFLMSFSCVLGISLLNSSIGKIIHKTKMPTKLADSLSISLSTMIALMFIMAYFFNTLNIISIIANLLIIPLFTVAFILIFIFATLSLLMPFVTMILYPVNYLLSFITVLSNILGNLAIANFATINLPYIAIIIYFCLLLVLSRYCLAKHKEKIFVSISLVALLVCCLI